MSDLAWVIVTERNDWEGEMWHTSFPRPGDPDAQALLELVGDLGGFTTRFVPGPMSAWDGRGYMPASVVFDGFDVPRFLAELRDKDEDDLYKALYKGGIRAYGSEERKAAT